MTNPPHTPPPTAHHERPFIGHPGRWERERARAAWTGHVRDHSCSAACEPVLVHERTPWGVARLDRPRRRQPARGPHQIGALTPAATRMQGLALRWLTRRPAQRIVLGSIPASLRLSVAAVALISLLTGLFAAGHGIPLDVPVQA
ncbi:hypothetical protein [Streptomyces sp. CA-106131]|uniref:hypothetical protein n=1 Tax=Streptomyces sp. CA-106131 TaxID=3240045 RepID=UPI003D8BD6C7